MMTSDILVDAKGLSCPQPVLMALNAMRRMQGGTITVLVDTETSNENVARAAASQGWKIVETKCGRECIRICMERI